MTFFCFDTCASHERTPLSRPEALRLHAVKCTIIKRLNYTRLHTRSLGDVVFSSRPNMGGNRRKATRHVKVGAGGTLQVRTGALGSRIERKLRPHYRWRHLDSSIAGWLVAHRIALAARGSDLVIHQNAVHRAGGRNTSNNSREVDGCLRRCGNSESILLPVRGGLFVARGEARRRREFVHTLSLWRQLVWCKFSPSSPFWILGGWRGLAWGGMNPQVVVPTHRNLTLLKRELINLALLKCAITNLTTDLCTGVEEEAGGWHRRPSRGIV